MLGAVTSLPSLGGLSAGVAGGPIPLVGLGVLNGLANQVTTRSFSGSPTPVPAFAAQELALGNFSNSFSNYFGSAGFPGFFGAAPAQLAWRQWSTGTAMSPLQVAPFGMAAAPSFGPGGPLGFGVSGMPLAFTPSFGGAQQLLPGFGQMQMPTFGPNMFAQPMPTGPVSVAPMPPMSMGQSSSFGFSPSSNWGTGNFMSQAPASDPATLSAQIERGLQQTLSQSSAMSVQFDPNSLNQAMAASTQQFQQAMEDQRVRQAQSAALAARVSEAGKAAQAAQQAMATKAAETARASQAAQAAQSAVSMKSSQAALAAMTMQLAQSTLNNARTAATANPTDAAASAAVQAAEAEVARATAANQAAQAAQKTAEADAARADQALRSAEAGEAGLQARAASATQAYESLQAQQAAIRNAEFAQFEADAMARMNSMQQQIQTSFSNSQRFTLPPR